MSDEQNTRLTSAKAFRRPEDRSPAHRIAGVDLSLGAGTLCVVHAHCEFAAAKPTWLIINCTRLQRFRGMTSDVAREVKLIGADDIVVNQSGVGERAVEDHFTVRGRAAARKRQPRLVRVELTPSGEGRKASDFAAMPPQELVQDLANAMLGGTPTDPVEVNFDPDMPYQADLMAEIEAILRKAAQKTLIKPEELSDLFFASSMAVWHALRIRPQIDRGPRQPKVILSCVGRPLNTPRGIYGAWSKARAQ